MHSKKNALIGEAQMNAGVHRTASLRASDTLICLALAFVTVLAFALFLRPPRLSDELVYFYSGANPEEIQATHQQLRPGIIWPVWFFVRLFGYSEFSYYLLPLLAALMFALGTWLLGRVLFGQWVGATAGVLAIVNPWVLEDLSHLLPDYVSAGAFTLAIAIVVQLGRSGRLKMYSFDSWLTSFALFVSGILFGWSYLAREYIIVFFPLIGLVLFVTQARQWSLIPLAAGSLICWGAELLWGWFKFGDPLIRLVGARLREEHRPFAGDTFEVLAQLPNLFNARPGGLLFTVLLLLAMAFSLALAGRGDWRGQLNASWLVGGWLFFTLVALIPVFLDDNRVLLRMHKFRYWAIILPPLFVGGVAALRSLLLLVVYKFAGANTPKSALVGYALLSIAIAVPALKAVESIWDAKQFLRNSSRHYLELRDELRRISDSRLVLVYYCCGGGIAAQNKSIPIYLNEWHGLERAWKGHVVGVTLPELRGLVEKHGSVLVALDETRGRGLYLYPPQQTFAAFVKATGKSLFRASDGQVALYALDANSFNKQLPADPRPTLP